jgi:hypothetical protein
MQGLLGCSAGLRLVGAALALVGLVAFWPATPAWAITTADCLAMGGTFALDIQPGGAITISSLNGTDEFVGQRTIKVSCKNTATDAHIDFISDATVQITLMDDPGGPLVLWALNCGAGWVIAGNPGDPLTAECGPFSSSASAGLTFFIASPTDFLDANPPVGPDDIGGHLEATIAGPLATQTGQILAFLGPPPPNTPTFDTPELDSFVLFGAGTLALAYLWRRRGPAQQS